MARAVQKSDSTTVEPMSLEPEQAICLAPEAAGGNQATIEQLARDTAATERPESSLLEPSIDWASVGLDSRRMEVLAQYGVPVTEMGLSDLDQMDALIAQAEERGASTETSIRNDDCVQPQSTTGPLSLDPEKRWDGFCGVEHLLMNDHAVLELGSYGNLQQTGVEWSLQEGENAQRMSSSTDRMSNPIVDALSEVPGAAPTTGMGLSDPLGAHLARVQRERAEQARFERERAGPPVESQEPSFMEKYGTALDYGARGLQLGFGIAELLAGGAACASGPFTGVGLAGCAVAFNGADNIESAFTGRKTLLGQGAEAVCGTAFDEGAGATTCEIATEAIVSGGLGAGAARGLVKQGAGVADDIGEAASRGLMQGADELAHGGVAKQTLLQQRIASRPSDKTTTLLGRSTDVRPMEDELLRLDPSLVESGANPGAYNVLNDPYWTNQRNQTWLQDSISRGDHHVAMSEPDLHNLYRIPEGAGQNGTSYLDVDGFGSDGLTVYGAEYREMLNSGYGYSPFDGGGPRIGVGQFTPKLGE